MKTFLTLVVAVITIGCNSTESINPTAATNEYPKVESTDIGKEITAELLADDKDLARNVVRGFIDDIEFVESPEFVPVIGHLISPAVKMAFESDKKILYKALNTINNNEKEWNIVTAREVLASVKSTFLFGDVILTVEDNS